MISALNVGFIFPFLVHVFLAQETFCTETKLKPPILPGFIGFHVDAKKALSGRGRPSAGLSSFFSKAHFADGKLKEEPSPLPWVLPVRWLPKTGKGIIFINIYVPMYTRGFDSVSVDIFENYLTSLRRTLPNDYFVLGGDFNVDRFRRFSPAGNVERYVRKP